MTWLFKYFTPCALLFVALIDLLPLFANAIKAYLLSPRRIAVQWQTIRVARRRLKLA